MKNVKTLVFLALFIAIQIILERYLAINLLPTLRITLGFLPIALAGIILGPAYAVIVGVAADVIGFFLFPSGTFFPGFTITGAVRGLIFGLVHYRHKVTFKRVLVSATVSTIICDLILNTIWLHILTGNAYAVFISLRIIKAGVMIPISIFLILAVSKATKSFIKPHSLGTT